MQTDVVRKPNLFIIGAPKCGTTALYTYLETHPEIAFSSMKEPRYFDTDQGHESKAVYFGPNHSIDRYLALFKYAKNEPILAEASPTYLSSEVAVPHILAFNPDAKCIVMVRNPVKQLLSLHVHRQYTSGTLQPLEDTFTPENPGPITTFYQHYCSTGSQLERAKQLIPASQLHVILFDDFCADTPGTYRDVLAFLGLPDDGRTDFTPVNEAKVRRSGVIEGTLHFYTKYLQKYVVRVKQALGIGRLGIADTIQRANSKPIEKPALPLETQQKLERVLEPEITKIESFTGRNLSHWYQASNT